MVINRNHWLQHIYKLWSKRSIVWLTGVRRSGKTVLAKNIPNVHYFDCELASTQNLLSDPERFLNEYHKQTIVLDEVHCLTNPTKVLKIAADHFPSTKIITTGSSTLFASAKFKDTLTGRKYQLLLTPLNWQDMLSFEQTSLEHRMIRGGLPPMFLAVDYPELEFKEWMDSYWAKDVQELFRIEKRYSFQKLVELLMINSGGIFEATRYATPCEISRASVNNYLNALELTHIVYVIRPYSANPSREIISAPKVYGFDTGFIAYYRGERAVTAVNNGLLWEHLVLNELVSEHPGVEFNYWRDKQGHELDFIIAGRGLHAKPIAIECKWQHKYFDPLNLSIFRKLYPEGRNYVVCTDVHQPFTLNLKGLEINFIGLQDLASLPTHIMIK